MAAKNDAYEVKRDHFPFIILVQPAIIMLFFVIIPIIKHCFLKKYAVGKRLTLSNDVGDAY